MIVRELVTRLGFSADETAVRRFGRAVDGLRMGLVAGAAAMGALSGAAVRLVNDTSRYGDELAKTADRLGITVDGLEQLRFAAERSGVSQQTLEMSLQRMTRRLSEAAQGAGEAQGALQELGLDAEMMASMTPQDQLEAISDALAGVENQSDRVRLAMRFFDSEGVRLLNLVGGGAEEIRQLREEFERLSGGLTEEQARASEEFQDKLTNLQTAMQGLRLQIGARLMPAMQPLLVAFTDFIVANREIIGQRIAEFFDRVAGAAQNLTSLAAGLWEGIQPLIEAFNNLPDGVKAAAAALAFFMLPMGRLKGLIIGGLLLGALEDIGAWMAGNESVIGDLIGPYEDFADTIGRWVEALGGAETIISVLVGIGFAKWLATTAAAFRVLGAALLANPIGLAVAVIAGGALLIMKNWDRVGPVVEAVVGYVSRQFEAMRERVEAVAEFIRTSANNIAEGWETFRDNIGGILDWVGDRFDALTARVQAFIDTIRNIRDTVSDAFTFEGDTPVDRRGRPVDNGGGGASGMFDPASFSVPSPSGPTVESAQGGAGVTNINTANAQATFSITVPPGTTSEQVAFIESTVERTLQREINNAILATEA